MLCLERLTLSLRLFCSITRHYHFYLTWMPAVTCTTSICVSFLPYMDASSHVYNIRTCLFLTLHGNQQSHVQHPYLSLSFLTWMSEVTCTTSIPVSFLPYMDASSHMFDIRTCLFLTLHGCQQSHVRHPYVSLSYLTWMPAVTCSTSICIPFFSKWTGSGTGWLHTAWSCWSPCS